jgi:prepilin-type processing-associated H-X9-DG protein
MPATSGLTPPPQWNVPSSYLNADGTVDFKYSYTINWWVAPNFYVDGVPPGGYDGAYVTLEEVDDMSRTVQLGDTFHYYYDYAGGNRWDYRHNGRVSLLYVDNHAAPFKDPEMDLMWWWYDEIPELKFLPYRTYYLDRNGL